MLFPLPKNCYFLLVQSRSYLIFKALVKWYFFLCNLLKMKLTSLLSLPLDDMTVLCFYLVGIFVDRFYDFFLYCTVS